MRKFILLMLSEFGLNQVQANIESLRCVHSFVAEATANLGGGWENVWDTIDLSRIRQNQHCYKLRINQDIRYINLRSDNLFLAAVYSEKRDKISVLFTTSPQMKVPLCSLKCGSRPCKCVRYNNFHKG